MKKQLSFLTASILASSVANAADLYTTFSSSHSKIALNNSITYTGSVANKGSDTANNVRLIFYMPPKNVSISNLPSGCSSFGVKITCSIGDLNASNSASRSVTVSYSKKSGNVVGVTAVTDSYDSNYSNNTARLTTNVSDSSISTTPAIPNIFSSNVSPTSILLGNTLTFNANLDAPLPNGYSVKVSYDGNNYVMSGYDTKYSLSQNPNSTGLKTYKTGIYDNYGNLKSNEMAGTFEVTKANVAPTLSFVSGVDNAMVGANYALQFQANDSDGNLSGIQITNWGDGSSDNQTATNGANLSFSHTFNNAGTYTISATAYDSAGLTSQTVSKTITVNAIPTATKGDIETFVSGDKTFSYTKIANDGSELPKTAQLGSNPKDWACTKDNNTGLIWEVKTDDGGLRDKDWYYSWYEPDASKNGGFEGYTHSKYAKCSTSDNCNTYAYTNAVNQQGLCGKKDWRLPDNEELKGLVYCSDGKYTNLGKEEYGFICSSNGAPNYNLTTQSPTINSTYFPNTQYSWFWSSSPYANHSSLAWYVHFNYGNSYYNYKGSGYYVRLVRG